MTTEDCDRDGSRQMSWRTPVRGHKTAHPVMLETKRFLLSPFACPAPLLVARPSRSHMFPIVDLSLLDAKKLTTTTSKLSTRRAIV